MARRIPSNAPERLPTSRSRPGVVARFFEWTGRVLRLVLTSITLSIVIEWVGIHFWWPELGVEHSRQMVRTESAFLAGNLGNSWIRRRPAAPLVESIATTAALLHQSPIARVTARAMQKIIAQITSSATWQRVRNPLRPYLAIIGNVSELYAIRLTVLCLAAPMFVLLAFIGLVDGLVQRDLRRWGGGRESAYVYHYAKRSNRVFLVLGAIVYLALPVSLHPALILLPFAAATAVAVSLTASRFKKYL